MDSTRVEKAPSLLASDAYSKGFHSMAPYGDYARVTYPKRNSQWRHRNWRNVLYVDGHIRNLSFRSAFTSNGSLKVQSPRGESYHSSYCFDPNSIVTGYSDRMSCIHTVNNLVSVADLNYWQED